MVQMWPLLTEFFLFLIQVVVQGQVDSTVSAVVGTRAVVRCPGTSMSPLILVVWKITPKNGTHCLLAYRVDKNETRRTNCSERMNWASQPHHDPALQIHPVTLTDDGNYSCEIVTAEGTFFHVSALTVLDTSTAVTLSPILYYSLMVASACFIVAVVVVLILYRTLKCRASLLSCLADDATVPNTTANNLTLPTRPTTVNSPNSSTTESIYENYRVYNTHENATYVKINK